ncbi:beta-ketoacyl-ACP synthase [Candidatus Enterovibrio escicola]|uniref:3-oxoacyl-[acyl-carrier-protein] synthase 2 n=1 Tax=Candidatus Enterovibrio escicola TaxID=1927127 RepID=A0A2A5T765_9GAMM|nr:beta-ketoacyl-ACP synthase [Candidatus Enterovibrio escacola]PCS23976.1 3-oxoacyl-[acyl-carrier-protein] synthase, KASII [Candidatus Enterovibrio escacola]
MNIKKKKKRVVITGIGLVSPLAHTVGMSWERLINCVSGIKYLPEDICSNLSVKIGGLVPTVDQDKNGGLDLDKFITRKDKKKSDRFIHLALIAAAEAIKQAGISDLPDHSKFKTATIIGTGIGGFHAITNSVNLVHNDNNKRLSPFTIPSFLANLAAAHVSIKYGYKGILQAPVTACAASVQSIGDGFKSIMHSGMDIAVVGGAESCINSVSLNGFNAAKALSTNFNAIPQQASRPFDIKRDGFVMSEGAGVLVLEELDHAISRRVNILAEIVGYGTTSDAYHITSGPANGEGAARAMLIAIESAEIKPQNIDYVNAHSTSTPLGDLAELQALKLVFGLSNETSISSTKSSTGHLLGAAGAVAAIFTIKAINESIIPASLNIVELPEEAFGLHIVANKPIKKIINYAMVNGFGFGGVNASVILKSYDNDINN